ncbi:MAG: hypothetical protein A3K19_01365 [Lentisphaerae bacterium RIFOXYB12_FULL_65_16]|nr:MAG: hypothetical protein A3K18_06245 [Lentisphaerae bacterium RIFOXYA12_64_32]OGV92546.1 MAG: hypothetical protein A3K19_01365 [Lentisphaerae bacterium RIFOXYB12_FULL_65_16]
MVTFVCKGCGAELEVPDAHASEAAECPLCGATLVVPMPGIVRDRMLGGFRIERRLGAGAMGEVWLATQVALGRKVALKILAPSYTRDVAFLKRFRNEVLTVAKLTHPNIVPAYDAGVDCGIHYLAMAFIDGTDLDRQLKVRKVVPEQEALAIVRKLAGALRYAWDKFKLIHRDIKPSNIMMDKAGVPLLMDLGLSKSVDQDHSLTVTGAVMGTPYYISPEQAKDEDALDFRCDLYSLGVTLYHMVTGRVPFDGTTMAGIMTKHIVEPFPPPRERNPAVTEECSVLLATMMAKNPGERQKSWQALITDIDLVLAGNMPETCWPDPGPSAVVPGMGEVPPRPHPVFKGARKAKVRQVDGTSAAVDAAAALPAPGTADDTVPIETAEPVRRGRSKALIWAIGAAVTLLAVGGLALAMRSHGRAVEAEKARRAEVVRQEAARQAEAEQRRQEEQAQVEAEARATAVLAAWDTAVDAAARAMTTKEDRHFVQAIGRFENVKTLGKTDKYAKLAAMEIARLRQAQDDAVAARRTADEAKRRAEEGQSAERRAQEEAKEARRKAEAEQRDAIEAAEQGKFNLQERLAERLLAGDGKAALALYRNSPARVACPEFESTLKVLADPSAALLDSLKGEIGRPVEVMVKGKKARLPLRKVAEDQFEVEGKSGASRVSIKLTPNDLPEAEKVRRLGAADKRAGAVCAAALAVEARQYAVATKALAALDGDPLAEALRERLEVIELGGEEAHAKKDLTDLLACLQLNADATAADVAGAPAPDDSATRAKLVKALTAFRDRCGKTAAARAAAPILVALEAVAAGPTPLGVAPEGLVAHWPCDEDSGTVVKDASGNGLDGVSTADWAPGKLGNAVLLSGETENIVTFKLPLDKQPGRSSFTVAMWVNPTTFAIKSESRVRQSFYLGPSPTNDSVTVDFRDDGRADFMLRLNQGSVTLGENVQTSTSSIVPIGSWTHVACVFDRENRKCRILLNGHVDNEIEVRKDLGGDFSGDSIIATLGTTWQSFAGLVDDVWCFKRALSTAEVRTLMNGGSGPSLVATEATAPREFTLSESLATPSGGDSPPLSERWICGPGWEWRDSALRQELDLAERAFAFPKTSPYGRNVRVEAVLTVAGKTRAGWGMAGVAVHFDDRNFWNVTLLEPPDDDGTRHYFELAEMRDGVWSAQGQDKLAAMSFPALPAVQWEYNRPYRLRIEMSPEGIIGTVEELDGTVRWKRGYRFSGPAVVSGQPGLTTTRYKSAYRDFRTTVSQFVDAPPPPPAPPFTLDELNVAIKTRNSNYDMSGSLLRDSQGAAIGFSAANKGIKNISGLKGKKLRQLVLQQNPVADISALKDMPLEVLDLGQTEVGDGDMVFLEGMPLTALCIGWTKVTNFGFLSRLTRIERLGIQALPVTNADLAHLRRLPLTNLDIAYSKQITDLKALEGMGLTTFLTHDTEIRDLKPLTGMPLKELQLWNCANIRDLSLLRQCQYLERLVIPAQFTDPRELHMLRDLPKLKYLDYKSKDMRTAEQFWKDIDSGPGQK